MRRRPFSRKHLLAAAVAALLVSSQLPSNWAHAISAPPRHLVSAALAPALLALRPVSERFAPHPAPAELTETATLRDDYEQALLYARQLEDQLRQAQQTIAQLSQARGQLNLTGVSLLTARVTAWSGGEPTHTVEIARGTRHDVQAGFAVASGFNLVGRVTDAGPFTATVELIDAPRTQLIVRIVPPTPQQPTRELVAQLQADPDTGTFRTVTDARSPVRVGDLAHLSDDAWPAESRGLVVGRVTAINPDPDDPTLRRRVDVQPMRPLKHLSRVVVIVPTAATVPPAAPPDARNNGP